MALSEPNHHHSNAALSLPLVDFDWKLQYAVGSGTIASVDKPLLRLELYVSKPSCKVDEVGLGRVSPESLMQTSISEFTRAQLQTLIGAMDAIEQALEGAGSAACL